MKNHKWVSVFLIVSIVLQIFTTSPAIVLANGALFNSNLVGSTGTLWATGGSSSYSGNSLSTDTESGESVHIIEITDSDLIGAIDTGNAPYLFGANSQVGEFTVLDPESPTTPTVHAKIAIAFGSSQSSAITASNTYSDQKNATEPSSFSYNTSGLIPLGTRVILIKFEATAENLETTTVNYSNINFSINDNQTPSINAAYTTAWTNQPILIDITATDDIGIQQITDKDAIVVSNNGSYQVSVTTNDTYSFTARDFAQKTATTSFTISNYDNIPPSEISDPTININTWTNQTVTISFPEINPNPEGQSPESYYSNPNSVGFSSFTGNILTVTEVGQINWIFNIQDQAGNQSSNQTTVTSYFDNIPPVISDVPFTRSPGSVNYTVNASDAHSGIQVIKYAPGTLDATYFETQGSDITATSTFSSTTGEIYTIFVKDNAGNTALYTTEKVNQLPSIAAIENQIIDEDTQLTLELSASDAETAIQNLQITLTSNNTTLLSNTTGFVENDIPKITISPNQNQYGSASVTVSVTDGAGESDSTTFDLTVNAVPDPPSAIADSGTINENTESLISVLENDYDVDGNSISIDSFTQPSHGIVTLEFNAEETVQDVLKYVPSPYYFGQDTYTYTITDGALTNTATVTINIQGINQSPIANDDTASTDEDIAVNINVLENDTDADLGTDPNEQLSVSIETAPAHGSTTITNNIITYHPNSNWNGTDQLQYRVTDLAGDFAIATVTIQVRSINDTPIILNLPASMIVDEGSNGNIFTFNVQDVENDDISVQVSSNNYNLISINDIIIQEIDPSTKQYQVTFNTQPQNNGNVDITVLISDGVSSNHDSVSITVSTIDDPPIAVNDDMTTYYEIFEDQPITLDLSQLLDNDSDVDSPTISITNVNDGSHGTFIVIDSNNNLYQYSPVENYAGLDTFTYTISDGNSSASATVSIQIKSVADKPIITLNQSNVYTIDEDQVSIPPILYTGSDIDSSYSELSSYASSSNEALISSDDIVISSDGNGNYQIQVAPHAHKNGTTTLTISLTDGVTTAKKTIEYTVQPVPDAPIAKDDEFTVFIGTSQFLLPQYNDIDYDDETLTITSFTQPSEGVVQSYNDGILYTAPNQIADYTFEYTISDGLEEDTATVLIHVRPQLDDIYLSLIDNQNVVENAVLDPITFTAYDPNDGYEIDSFDIISSDISIVDDGKISGTSGITITRIGTTDQYQMQVQHLGVIGDTTITLTATGTSEKSYSRTFIIHVLPYFPPPIANDDSISGTEDINITFTQESLLANDSNYQGTLDGIVFSRITSFPSHGLIQYSGGVYTYNPDSNFNGTDTFKYVVKDAGGESNEATVSLILSPVNDRPYAENNYYTLENTIGATLNLNPSPLGNDYDLDGDTIYLLEIVTPPQHGIITSLDQFGNITYQRTELGEGEYAHDSFTYRIIDRDPSNPEDPDYVNALTTTATVVIQSHYATDFYLYNRYRTIQEDSSEIAINIYQGNSTGQDLFFVSTSGNTLGTSYTDDGIADPNISQNGVQDMMIYYTPNPSANGTDVITYVVGIDEEGTIRTKQATVTIYIEPVNDAPYFVSTIEPTSTTNEDTPIQFNIEFNDIDNNNADLEFKAYAINTDDQNPVAYTSQISINRTSDSTATVQVNPYPNAYGDVEIVFFVSDGQNKVEESTILTVVSQPDPPSAYNLITSLEEDKTKKVEILNTSTDPDSDLSELEVLVAIQPEHGTAYVDSNNNIVYNPSLNYFGTDQLTYRIQEIANPDLYDTATLTFIIESVNDAPYIYNYDYYRVINEDTQFTIDFTAFDYEDRDANIPLRFEYISDDETIIDPSTFVYSETGDLKTLTITPEANQFGLVNLNVRVIDSEDLYTDVEFLIRIASVNDVPVAVNDTIETDEDIEITVNLLTNDSDVEDDLDPNDEHVYTITEITDPINGGQVINNYDGTVTYIPLPNFYGSDQFTYTLTDSNNADSIATVDVTVNPVNDPPVAKPDSATTEEEQTLELNLLINDTDIELDTLSINNIYGYSLASSVTFSDGIMTYVPTKDQIGTDTFYYDLSDGESITQGQITVTIKPVNDPPELNNSPENPMSNDNWVMDEDTTQGFLIELSDVETPINQLIMTIASNNDTLLPLSAISVGTNAEGNRIVTLSPLENQYGTVTLTITISDGTSESSSDFPVIVNPVNDLPTLTVQNLNIDEDSTPVPYNDNYGIAFARDVETITGNFVYSISITPINGIVSIDQTTGRYFYTPNANFYGSDSFEVTALDEGGATVSETVLVTINQQADPPVAVDDTAITNEDTPVSIPVLANDTDNDINIGTSDTLSIAAGSISAPTHGTAIIDPNDETQILYTPQTNNNNDVTFTYQVKDEAGNRDTATVTIEITPVKDTPFAGTEGNDTYTIDEDEPVALYNVLINDDPDTSDPLNQTVTDSLTLLTISCSENADICEISTNQLRYEPKTDYFGTDTVTYTMQDEDENQATFTVTFNIAPVNDAPHIDPINDISGISEDQIAAITTSITISDIEDAGEFLSTSFTLSDTFLIENTQIIGTSNSRTFEGYAIPNRSGWIDVTIKVTDQGGLTDSETFRITIDPVDDTPTPIKDEVVTDENTTIDINVLSNDDLDLDWEGDILSIQSINDINTPAYGSFSIVNKSTAVTTYNSDGTSSTSTIEIPHIRFIPNADWDSSIAVIEQLSYQMSQDADPSTTYTGYVDITINPVNDNPEIVITETEISYDEDAPTPTEIIITVTDEEDADDTLTVNVTDIRIIANDDTPEDEFITLSNITISPVSGEPSQRKISFTSQENQYGTADIDFQVKDSENATNIDALRVVINPTNDAPTDGDDSYIINEDTPTLFNVLINDDVDSQTSNQTLSVVNVTQPTNGLVEIVDSTDPVYLHQIRYTPTLNYNNTSSNLDTFTYTVQDEEGVQFVNTVSVEVQPVNDAPVLYYDGSTITTPEGQPYQYVILYADDVDDDNSILELSGTSNNLFLINHYNNGIVITKLGIESSGIHTGKQKYQVELIPAGKYNGTVNLSFTVEDDDNYSVIDESSPLTDSFQLIQLDITFANDGPIANTETIDIAEDDLYGIDLNLLSNDTDLDLITNPDYEKLSIDQITNISPSGIGNFEIDSNSENVHFIQTLSNWNGLISFTYEISDVEGATSSTTSYINITPVNDPPVAADDYGTVDEDNSVTINLINGAGTDTDIDTSGTLNLHPSHITDEIKIQPNSFTGVEHGSVELSPDQLSITYTPILNFNGIETFAYTVIDLSGATDTALVEISVTAVQDAPVANNDSITVQEDTTSNWLNITSNDLDIDADDELNLDLANKNSGTLNITQINSSNVSEGDTVNTTYGQITLTSNKLYYTPNATFVGEDSFTYQITNDDNLVDSATVNITIENVNDTPIALDNTINIDEDSIPINIEINPLISDADLGYLGSDSSTLIDNNETLVVNIISSSDQNDISFDNTTNILTYSPKTNFNGVFSITYRVTDFYGAFAENTITINVAPIQDSPTAENNSYTINEDTTNNVFTVLANDIDTDAFDDLNQDLSAKNTQPLSITKINNISIAEDETISTSYGQVTLQSSELQYSPNAGFVGQDSFIYQITNQDNLTDTASVTINVENINDPPTAQSHSETINEDTSSINISIIPLIDDPDLYYLGNDNSQRIDNEEQLTVSIQSSSDNSDISFDNNTNILTYNPKQNFNGEFSITYRVTDFDEEFAENTITINVLPIQDSPAAIEDTFTVYEDTNSNAINVLSNDIDIDSDNQLNQDTSEKNTLPLVITQVNNQPIIENTKINTTYGQVTLQSNQLLYTPNPGFVGQDSFIYHITNQDNLTDETTVSITVQNVNDAPTAQNESVTIPEDTASSSVQINILIDDSDLDMLGSDNSQPIDSEESLTVSIINATDINDIEFIPSTNQLTYYPDQNFNGVFTVVYRVTDNDGLSQDATITYNVTPVGDAPVGEYHNFIYQEGDLENTAQTIDILSYVTDIDLNTNPSFEDLTISEVTSSSSYVTLSIASDKKSITALATADFNGEVSFSYKVKDAYNLETLIASTITISQVNDNPITNNQITSTNEDQTLFIDLVALSQDIDTDLNLNLSPNSDWITLNSISYNGDQNGTASIESDQKTLRFIPKENYNGTQLIDFTIIDQHGGTDSATLTITIISQPDKPVANNDIYSIAEDTPSLLADVVFNDTNIDSIANLNAIPDTILNLISIEQTEVQHGIASIQDNKILYIPDANYYGIEEFHYSIQNGGGETATGLITINISSEPDAPVALDITDVTVSEDSSILIDLNSYIYDNDPPDQLTLSITIDSTYGATLIDDNQKTILYTPNPNFNGTDSIEYQVTDLDSLTDTGTISIQINQVNDQPIAIDDSGTGLEDENLIINLLGNDSDIDTDSNLNENPSNEWLEIDPNGFLNVENGSISISQNDSNSIIFTPNSNWNGSEEFTYTTIDQSGEKSTANVSIIIDPVDDSPQSTGSFVLELNEDDIGKFDLSSHFTDPDISINGDNLRFSVGSANNGKTSTSGSQLTYTPNNNYNGPDQVTITATDTSGNSIKKTLQITVNQQNDTPITNKASSQTTQAQSVIIQLLSLANDIDLDATLNKDTSYSERLSIVENSFSGLSHGSVEITTDRTGIIYTPNPEWFGIETFDYSITDNSGSIATSQITIETLQDSSLILNDSPLIYGTTISNIPLLEVISPSLNEKHKDGDQMSIRWQIRNKPIDTTYTYSIEFYDGNKWIIVDENLSYTFYRFTIPQTNMETDQAKFRVTAKAIENTTQLIALSNTFIIDNVAPRQIDYQILNNQGQLYENQNLISGNFNILITNGQDLTNISYWLSVDDGQSLFEIDNFILPEGISNIHFYAKDELENTILIKQFTVDNTKNNIEKNDTSENSTDEKAKNEISLKRTLLVTTISTIISGSIFWLLFFLLRRNVIVELYSNGNKIHTLKFFKSPKKEQIELILKDKYMMDADYGQIKIKKGLVRKIKTKNVNIFNHNQKLIEKFYIPQDQEDIFISEINW